MGAISEGLKKGICKFCSHANMGDFIRTTGTISWALSCIAYTCAVIFNDKIPKEQKKFLVPQEIIDGAINVTLYWTITSRLKKFGEIAVDKGLVLPKSLKSTFLKEVKKHPLVKPDKVDWYLNNSTTLQEYLKFKKTFSIASSLAGSIVAVAIVTPITRNIVAKGIEVLKAKMPRKVQPAAPASPHVLYERKKSLTFDKYISRVGTPDIRTSYPGLKI